MRDWEGNMVERRHRTQVLLSDVEENANMSVSAVISSIESRTINRVLEVEDVLEEKVAPMYQPIPRGADEIASVFAGVSPILDDVTLYERLSARSELGKFTASIGSTDAPNSAYLVTDDDTAATDPTSTNEDYDANNDLDDNDQRLDEIYEGSLRGEIDLDEFLVSASHAQRTQGVDAAHLSKVWRISHDAA